MKEHIYTIPLNDAFSKNDGCAFCRLFATLEKNEVKRITGAAMMEPGVRVETNEHGFCFRHFKMIANSGKRHPTALIIQSHLEEITKNLSRKKGKALTEYVKNLNSDCYICNRLDDTKSAIMRNFFYLIKNDEKFAEKFEEQSNICFPHAESMLKFAESELSKKEAAAFAENAAKKLLGEISVLQEDIDWFCKKFDYRYRDEDWKNSRDSIERTVIALTGQNPSRND